MRATASLLLDCVELLALLALLCAQWRTTLAEPLALQLVVLRHVVISFGLLAPVGVGGSKYTESLKIPQPPKYAYF